MLNKQLRIGDFAKHTASNVETVRYYEREGLLPERTRTSGNYRLYGELHVERLMFIKRCRTLDMTLSEIRSLLSIRDDPQQHCYTVKLLLDKHILDTVKRIQELQAMQLQLESLRALSNSSQSAKGCRSVSGA